MSEINFERFEKSKKYILDKIKNSDFPKGHPFLEDTFENDYVCIMLTLIKYFLLENVMIDDFIKKLKSNEERRFDLEKYYQSLSEVTFFYYLLSGTIVNGIFNNILQIVYEPNSPFNPEKKLEYSFCFTDNIIVNVEIKTITCDPFIKEKDLDYFEKKIILKKYFHDTNLNDYFSEEELFNYRILDVSTHYRQISKNIKKIKEKFDGIGKRPLNMINIGVIVIQFATSIEEFYSYMFHPSKGLLYKIDFGNIDCLVFFSLTAKAEFDMQDIYDKHHIFSVLFREDDYIGKYIEYLRLNHIAATTQIINSPYMEDARKEFGRFRIINESGFVFFSDYDIQDEEIDQYIQYLKGQSSLSNY